MSFLEQLTQLTLGMKGLELDLYLKKSILDAEVQTCTCPNGMTWFQQDRTEIYINQMTQKFCGLWIQSVSGAYGDHSDTLMLGSEPNTYVLIQPWEPDQNTDGYVVVYRYDRMTSRITQVQLIFPCGGRFAYTFYLSFQSFAQGVNIITQNCYRFVLIHEYDVLTHHLQRETEHYQFGFGLHGDARHHLYDELLGLLSRSSLTQKEHLIRALVDCADGMCHDKLLVSPNVIPCN